MYSKELKINRIRNISPTNSVSETIRILGYPTGRQLYTWITEENIMKSLLEQFGGTYHKESDYLIPNLTLCKSEKILNSFISVATMTAFLHSREVEKMILMW